MTYVIDKYRVINPSMYTHFYSCQSSVQKTPCGAAPTLPSSAPCSPPTVTVSGDPGMMGLKQRVNLDTERRVNDPQFCSYIYLLNRLSLHGELFFFF